MTSQMGKAYGIYNTLSQPMAILIVYNWSFSALSAECNDISACFFMSSLSVVV